MNLASFFPTTVNQILAPPKRRPAKEPVVSVQIGPLEPRQLLTVGADGWTILATSVDSRVIFVSSSAGNDANSGLSENLPVKTIAKAFTLVRDDSPDWVMLKRGDVFNEGRLPWYKGGRSTSEPMVVTSYGVGARPVLDATGFLYWGPNGGPSSSLDFLSFVGLQFEADWENNQTSTPHTNAFLMGGGLNSFLIEDCSFSGYREAVQIDYVAGGQPINGVTVRRSEFYDNAAQGVLSYGASDITIEQNVFDRIGWKLGETNIFRHGIYIKEAKNCTITGNIFARCSNFGSKLSSDVPGAFTDFVVTNNLYFNNGISLDHSQGSTGDVQTTFTHERGLISDNVFTEIGRTFETGMVQDMGAWLLNTKDIEWDSNLFVHKALSVGNPMFTWREHHENISVHDTIVYDWVLGGLPRITPQDYLQNNAQVINGYTLNNNELDLPAASYVDPTRTVGSYYASIGGANNPIAFLLAARTQSKANWNPAFTADAVNDYIRAGFARVLATPVFATPADSTTANPLQTVSWNTIDGADGYEVWYSNLTTGQSPAFIQSTNSNSYTPATALPIGKYQVWVRASQNNGPASPWSTPILLRVNAAPVLNSLPSNGVSARPQLSWNPLPGAVKYEVWGDNVMTGATKVVSATNVTQTTFTPTSDLGFSLYRFWVRGIDAKGVFSQWSLAQDYSRLSLTSVIQPVLSNGIDARPTITWAAVQGAVRYELWANNLTTGAIAVINNASIIGTSFTPAVPLSFDTYRLWVRAFDSISRVTPWSNPLDVATVPTLLSPVQPTFERRPTFTWAPSAIAVSYDLWINIANAVTTQTALTGTSWTPTSDLPIGDMSWWVRPKGADGVLGPWSKKAESSIGGRSAVLTAGVPGNNPGQNSIFTWKAVTGAGRYILQVDLVGVGTVVRQDHLTTTSFTTPAPLAVGQYRVWIKAIDGSDNVTGIWSNAFAFTVVETQTENRNSPAIPQLATRELESVLSAETLTTALRPVISDNTTASQQAVRSAEFPLKAESKEPRDLETESIDDWTHPAIRRESLMSEHEANLIDLLMADSCLMDLSPSQMN